MAGTYNSPAAFRFEQLRAGYASRLPGQLRTLGAALTKAADEQPDATEVTDALALAHRLAGTAGTYGFAAAADLAGQCEQFLNDYRMGRAPSTRVAALLTRFSQLSGSGVSALHVVPEGQGQPALEDSTPVTEDSIGARILVIDDDDDFLALISEILAQSSYVPISRTDGRNVADLIASTRPELVLLDVEMPEVDGFEVCRAIRADERWQSLPVVFLTGRNAVEDRIAAFQVGGDDFINKPIVAEELLARVGIRVQKGRMARERETLLRQAEKHRESLLFLLDQLEIGTLLLDGDGRIEFISRYCAMIGLDPKNGIGQHWKETLPLDTVDQHRFQEQLELAADLRVKLAFSWTDADQRYFVECEVRDAPTAVGRRIVCLTDVTELRRAQKELLENRYGRIIGKSEPMRELYALIDEVAKGDWTVLIEGETGTGKELVAHAIHAASPRKDGPFVAVNSAGLSESLLASQLFGHRKGAFTGAVADQKGFFESAQGGTLFLDEIGDLPTSMQASLLRVLEEKEITRLGETRTRKMDVRILAATHKDLAREAQDGRFRSDLLYRLRVARICVPSLRDRKADIPLLVEAFLDDGARVSGMTRTSLAAEALRCLLSYDWPGNVRELKAAIDYASIRCRGESIGTVDLPPEIDRSVVAPARAQAPRLPSGDERSRILSALARTGGNRVQAAKLLEMSRATFYRRLTKYGISKDPQS